MTDGIKTVKDGAVLEITIDRPKANAIDLKASRRLNQVVSSFRDDPELRIAIITGAGERFFSPGWDLKAAAAGENPIPIGVGGLAAELPGTSINPSCGGQRHRLRRGLRNSSSVPISS